MWPALAAAMPMAAEAVAGGVGGGGLWTGIGSGLSGLLGNFGGGGFLGGLGSSLMSGVTGLGSSLGGSLFGGGGGGDDFEAAYWMAQDANAFNRYSAILQNDWNRSYQATANQHADDAATTAYLRNKEEYANRYQTTANDMAKAGLNRILAVSPGGQVGGQAQAPMAGSFSGSAGMTAPQANVTSAAKDLATMRLMEKEGQKITAETGRTEAETERIGYDIKKIESEVARNYQGVSESIEQILKIRAEASLLGVEERNKVQEFNVILGTVKKLEMEVYRMAQEVRESESRQTLNYSQTDVNRAKLGEIKATIGKIEEETQNLNYTGKELKTIADVYSTPVGQSLVLAERAAKGGYLGNILGNYYRGGNGNPMMDYINNLKIPYGRK